MTHIVGFIMTDDRANPVDSKIQNNQPQNNQSTNNQSKNTQAQKPMPNNASINSSNVNNSAARPAAKAESAPEPQIKKVDVVIAGVTYPIYCPAHEQEELHSAVSYINNYALDLKRDAPSLSQESLLVLCCLNLYEKIHANQRDEEDRLQQTKQSEALLSKIMKDAHSIL